MWEIIHWYFLHMVQPNPFFHVVATCMLFFASYHTKPMSKKDIVPSAALFCMYLGFHMASTIEHLAFTPWWVVTLTGLRHREFFIWLGGVMVGIYLLRSTLSDIHAHLLLNLAQMFHPLKMSLRARAIVHALCMIMYVNDPKLRDAQYRDVLVGASCVVTSLVKTRPDFFSLSMMFSGPIALCTFILHALEINWYKFYRNNHFKRVKHSYYFIYPIVIVLLSYGVNVFSYLPYRLNV